MIHVIERAHTAIGTGRGDIFEIDEETSTICAPAIEILGVERAHTRIMTGIIEEGPHGRVVLGVEQVMAAFIRDHLDAARRSNVYMLGDVIQSILQPAARGTAREYAARLKFSEKLIKAIRAGCPTCDFGMIGGIAEITAKVRADSHRVNAMT